MGNTYKNTAFWSWNADIKKEEALLQIADFKDKGYGGVFIHARGGLEIAYMGKEWFEIFDACVTWAAENDFDIWIYDEFGWPSGFGGGKVNGLGKDYQMKRLFFDEKPRKEDGYELFNTYMVGAKTYYVYLYADENYVDLLSLKVTRAFIESTHEIYYERYKKYFGNVIKGIFTDEPQISVFYPYSEEIARVFQRQYGVDFHAEAWKLFVDCPEREAFFYKYYGIIADLLTENFTRPLSKWCEERGVVLTGHFAEEDGLLEQRRAVGGVMRNYEVMQQPGVDFLGRRLASCVLLKQLSSIKNQFAKPIALSETFGCSGWSTSFAQFAWIWGYQAALGINKACLHLSAYTIRGTRKRDYPAFFSYQEPWWDCFGALSAEMEKMNEFNSRAKQKCDVLLISPLTSIYLQQYDAYKANSISAQFRQTVENLLSKQYAFDIGDERVMRDFGYVDTNGKLRIGEGEYGYVLVSEAINLEKETWELLKTFLEKGGKIAFINAKPEKCNGEKIPEKYANVLQNMVIANRAGLIEKYLRGVGHMRKAKITDICDGQVFNELLLNITEDEKEVHIFAQNTACGKELNGCLFVREYGQFYADNKLDTTLGEKGVYTHVSIPPMGQIFIRLAKGEKPVSMDEEFISASALPFHKAKLTADNSLNIDKAYFEINGEKSGWIDTALLQDEINRTINERKIEEATVNVAYSFIQKEKLESLKVAVETRGTEKIVWNGTDVKDRFNGWYIDKEIHLADVTDLQKLGGNLLVVSYKVRGEKSYEETLEAFETKKNLFHYKSEAESVYLVGKFSVENKNPVYDDGYLTTDFNEFVITQPIDIDYKKELTQQGLYFYRGGVKYEYTLVKNSQEKVYVHFEDFAGVTAKIKVNGKEKCIINPVAKTELTELLQEGDNELTLIVYSSNRNILGPFHHKSGNPAMVGNSTFRGKKGFEDSILYNHFENNTCDEKYRFVKFGAGRLIVEKYNKG